MSSSMFHLEELATCNAISYILHGLHIVNHIFGESDAATDAISYTVNLCCQPYQLGRFLCTWENWRVHLA